jgi:hypothetical protein
MSIRIIVWIRKAGSWMAVVVAGSIFPYTLRIIWWLLVTECFLIHPFSAPHARCCHYCNERHLTVALSCKLSVSKFCVFLGTCKSNYIGSQTASWTVVWPACSAWPVTISLPTKLLFIFVCASQCEGKYIYEYSFVPQFYSCSLCLRQGTSQHSWHNPFILLDFSN